MAEICPQFRTQSNMCYTNEQQRSDYNVLSIYCITISQKV